MEFIADTISEGILNECEEGTDTDIPHGWRGYTIEYGHIYTGDFVNTEVFDSSIIILNRFSVFRL